MKSRQSRRQGCASLLTNTECGWGAPEGEGVRADRREQNGGHDRMDHGSSCCHGVGGAPGGRCQHDAIRLHLHEESLLGAQATLLMACCRLPGPVLLRGMFMWLARLRILNSKM